MGHGGRVGAAVHGAAQAAVRPSFETQILAWVSVSGVFRGLVDPRPSRFSFAASAFFFLSNFQFHILCANFLNFLELKASSCLDFRGHGEKFFHADQGYFRLYPSNVAAYWIALDTADETNGTMHGANVFNDFQSVLVNHPWKIVFTIWIDTFMISMVVCSGAAVAHRWHPSPHAGRLRAARRRRARHRCPCELPTHTFF